MLQPPPEPADRNIDVTDLSEEEDAMTQAGADSPSTSEPERARQAEEAAHNPRREEHDLDPADAADAAEYVAGQISLDEYSRRTCARYSVPEEPGRASADPVAVFDAMWEAGTSLFGSYVWLKRHADSEEKAERWWAAALAVKARRAAVDARDTDAQRQATAEFIAQERAVATLVRV